MILVEKLKQQIRKRNEVDAKEYYTRFLKGEDINLLRHFVSDFGSNLEIPCVILAVGSSVFQKKFWDYRKKINEANKKVYGSGIGINYRDIDLVVVPQISRTLSEIEKGVQDSLEDLEFKWEAHDITTLGNSYHEQNNGSYAPFLHFGYGLHSISTHLRNGTKLDLILGREDISILTAEEKITQERKGNYPFSILYKKLV